jgi:hypothetical protein
MLQALCIFREDAWSEDLWQSAASLVVSGNPRLITRSLHTDALRVL